MHEIAEWRNVYVHALSILQFLLAVAKRQLMLVSSFFCPPQYAPHCRASAIQRSISDAREMFLNRRIFSKYALMSTSQPPVNPRLLVFFSAAELLSRSVSVHALRCTGWPFFKLHSS